ncbi:type III pantothenate kinase [Pseudoxanthomonas dokdonensis]|uniref:Type III pantothenate kinase n=1 Tax=Pseudoxanthomonas dokdonensis TaxID=344882 RepID=A0A0R0CJU0_9GAMM|nr:type III pantothenate kinase [Pseudoxanthomonas dokdonensis]KRG69558.1 hypothetical protein ABB29_08740 [Pseudoxanthomonas dokdonensis]
MSRWLFDLGNTRLKIARLGDDGQLLDVNAIAHAGQDFADALARSLDDAHGHAYVASVASAALNQQLREQLIQRFKCISMARSSAGWGSTLRIAYPDPARLGVDRFLAMLGARMLCSQDAVLVVGIGTAVTVDLVDADGRHHGGLIAPSPALMRQSLQQAAAQLPASGGEPRPFADNTADGLASGALFSTIGLIERCQRQASELLQQPARLILHGGGAPPLWSFLPASQHAPSLVLEGLAVWARAGLSSAAATDRIAAC